MAQKGIGSEFLSIDCLIRLIQLWFHFLLYVKMSCVNWRLHISSQKKLCRSSIGNTMWCIAISKHKPELQTSETRNLNYLSWKLPDFILFLMVCTARSVRPLVAGWYGGELLWWIAFFFRKKFKFLAGKTGSVIGHQGFRYSKHAKVDNSWADTNTLKNIYVTCIQPHFWNMPVNFGIHTCLNLSIFWKGYKNLSAEFALDNAFQITKTCSIDWIYLHYWLVVDT